MVMLGHAWVYGVGDEGNLEVEIGVACYQS